MSYVDDQQHDAPSIEDGTRAYQEPALTDEVCVNCGTLIDEYGRCGYAGDD